MRQYRHSIRQVQIAFPRGFGEPGLGPVENAAKELKEEIGASVTDAKVLGEVVADSGLLGNKVAVVECRIDKAELMKGNEGIIELILLDEAGLDRYISEGKITDGYTLSAWIMHKKV